MNQKTFVYEDVGWILYGLLRTEFARDERIRAENKKSTLNIDLIQLNNTIGYFVAYFNIRVGHIRNKKTTMRSATELLFQPDVPCAPE